MAVAGNTNCLNSSTSFPSSFSNPLSQLSSHDEEVAESEVAVDIGAFTENDAARVSIDPDVVAVLEDVVAVGNEDAQEVCDEVAGRDTDQNVRRDVDQDVGQFAEQELLTQGLFQSHTSKKKISMWVM